MDKFHIRLKECREKKKDIDPKWTQGYIAEKIGVARVTYTAYENGTKQPPLETINRIADILDVTTDYLAGRTDSPKASIDKEDAKKLFYINKIANDFPDIDLMFKDMQSLSAEEMQDVYEYIKFKMSKKKDG